jgi:hypothetical protein
LKKQGVSPTSRTCRATPDLEQHDPEVISIFFGALLGNAFLVPTENGVRVAFDTRSAVLEQVSFQEDEKGSYEFELYNTLVALQRFSQHEDLLTTWQLLKDRGYCSTVAPSVELDADNPRGAMVHTSFETYPLKDLDFLFQMFYLDPCGLPEMGFLGLQKRVPAEGVALQVLLVGLTPCFFNCKLKSWGSLNNI